jgi:nucleotide-binding universal stress UspA family protein
MKQFKDILIVAPLNEQVLSQAKELMVTRQSTMALMSVVPELETPSVTTKEGRVFDLQTLLQEEVQTDLENTAATLKDGEFRVKTVVAVGNHAFIKVINQVQSGKHDLVMMLADGVKSIREQLFGTLSMHLMRKCPCAVWVVKPTRRRKLRNVFAAVDPDPENATRDQLNVQILKRAAAVAQSNQAKLHVIHVWNSLGGDASRSRRWMNKQEIRLYVEKLAESHRSRLNQLLEKHADGSEIVHMLQGRPGTVIPKTIADMKGDLLVMGTVCRTGIPGFFIGNTAETILSQVDCSVLTVKPKGFVTPVNAK